MRHHAAHAFPVVASALAVAIAICGCANDGTASGTAPSTRAPLPATASAPVYGPHGPDPACADVLKAEQTLQSHQNTDQNDESAIDQDFTNFAQALGTAAQHESNPATAKAMTALADDYNALVESQSGAAELPDMTTVENDGTTVDKACS
jgi:hypothetical protein